MQGKPLSAEQVLKTPQLLGKMFSAEREFDTPC